MLPPSFAEATEGKPRGRGAAGNPPNRFEKIAFAPDAEGDGPSPRTEFLRDVSRSLITYNESPDVGFDAGINPYRGCEHGCVYCYARPSHEYLGFSSGLDFETRILVKDRAPEILRDELASPRWRPRTLALSGNTDCYQPVERRLGLTRRCLEVLAGFRNPVTVITKNHLVTRDLDLLGELARHGAASVCVSVTTLDAGLARTMEPRTSTPARRLEAISALAKAGVPVGVLVAPVIPGLTDHEIPSILASAAAAGARFAGRVMLKLPHAVKDLFVEWLERTVPHRKDRVLARIRDVRGGRLNDPRFGARQAGEGPYAVQVHALFELARKKAGLDRGAPELSTAAFRRPPGPQLLLFD